MLIMAIWYCFCKSVVLVLNQCTGGQPFERKYSPREYMLYQGKIINKSLPVQG